MKKENKKWAILRMNTLILNTKQKLYKESYFHSMINP